MRVKFVPSKVVTYSNSVQSQSDIRSLVNNLMFIGIYIKDKGKIYMYLCTT